MIDNPEENNNKQNNNNNNNSNNSNSNNSNSFGAIDNIIRNILIYITSPWKLITVVVLILVLWFASITYNNVDFLRNFVEKKIPEHKINLTQADKVIVLLKSTTGIKAALLYSYETANNQKKVLRAYDRDGRDRDFEGSMKPIFTNVKENNMVISTIISNQIQCHEVLPPINASSIWFESHGAKYICTMSLPSDSFRFVAEMSLGWEKKPPDDELVRIKEVMTIIGAEIIND